MSSPAYSTSSDEDSSHLAELKAKYEAKMQEAAEKKERRERKERKRYQYAIRKDTLKPARNGLLADGI